MVTIVYWGYIGIMEQKLESTIWSLGFIGFKFLKGPNTPILGC